jgi:hypothetical protein
MFGLSVGGAPTQPRLRILPPKLVIGQDQGFDGTDLFNRRSLGVGLSNLLAGSIDPLVVAVDGDWGSGKTIFLNQLAGHLKKDGFQVLRFDAFQADYNQNPFVPLVSRVLADMATISGDVKAQKFKETAIAAAKVLGKGALKLTAGALTAGLLTGSTFDNLADDLSGLSEEIVDKYIGEEIVKSVGREKTLQQFREALEKFAGRTAEEALAGSGLTVLIVDELDRCRPTFAIDLLEKLKHLFSVPNLHIILGTNLSELGKSVSAVYGANVDGQRYLQKFVNLGVEIGNSCQSDHMTAASARQAYIDFLYSKMGFSSVHFLQPRTIKPLLKHLSEHGRLSLRDIERFMSALAIAVLNTRADWFWPTPVVVGLVFLKLTAPSLFQGLREGTVTLIAAQDAMGLTKSYNIEGSLQEPTSTRFFWKYCLDDTLDDETSRRFSGGWSGHQIDRKDTVRFVIDNLVSPTSEIEFM